MARKRGVERSREARLWIGLIVLMAASFPEVRYGVIDTARRIKDKNYPGKIKDKIHEATRRKGD